jgi:hypothetical protein
MANPVYHAGNDGKAKVTPPGGTTPVELPVNKWDLTIKGNNKDVSNAKDGRKRIPGVEDADGNLSMHLDTANPQWDTTTTTGPSVRQGTVLALELIEDGGAGTTADSFRLSAIVDDVKVTSAYEGTIDYDCKFSLESGTVKFPGDT